MHNLRKAIIYMLLSSLSFALMGAMIKLAGDIPLVQKIFFRNLVSLFVAWNVIRKNRITAFGKKSSQKWLLARSLLGLSGVVFYFYAINNLVLADSSMLNKLSPFFVTIFAGIFLKESITKKKIMTLFIVFAGAMFIIKPSFSMTVIPALSGFMSAIFAGAAYTLVRYLKNLEKPATIVFYFSFISVLGTFPFMLMKFQNPNLLQWFALISTGIFAAIGQFTLTHAYREAPASDVAIFNYTNIVFSGIVGFALWKEVPDHLSLVGGAIIIGTATVVYITEKKRNSS